MDDPRPYSPEWIRRRLEASSKRIHQGLGQHYLVNPGAVTVIAEACRRLAPGPLVLEIGAGLGVLTHALLEAGLTVRAVEIEEVSGDILADTLGKTHGDRFTLLRGDFLAMEPQRLTGGLGRDFLVCGNLPYNRVGEILLRCLEVFGEAPPALVFMMQREVAQKLASPPGRREYGALSVIFQALYLLKPVMNLAPGSFHPPPKIESTVLSFLPERRPGDLGDWPRFLRVVRASFGHRRKKISGALRDSGQFSPTQLSALKASRPELMEKRAENLSWGEFKFLSDGVPD
ncbi:MAG: hypothetical protein J0L75_01145 [Spirochaetes bacterium]|nr:hypothetical protein [Spirochaetota bacterium]